MTQIYLEKAFTSTDLQIEEFRIIESNKPHTMKTIEIVKSSIAAGLIGAYSSNQDYEEVESSRFNRGSIRYSVAISRDIKYKRLRFLLSFVRNARTVELDGLTLNDVHWWLRGDRLAREANIQITTNNGLMTEINFADAWREFDAKEV